MKPCTFLRQISSEKCAQGIQENTVFNESRVFSLSFSTEFQVS